MIEIAIPNDVLKYKPKLIGPFSTREFFSVAIAGALAYGAYSILHDIVPMDQMGYIIVLLVAPVLACGFYVPSCGMPLEKLILSIFKNMFLMPRTRMYQIDNIYEDTSYLDNYDDILPDVLEEAMQQAAFVDEFLKQDDKEEEITIVDL